MRVVVLGAGFGGLELTTRLSEEFGDTAEIVLIDATDTFVMGAAKLDVLVGRVTAEAVQHPYRSIVKRGVRFVQTTVRAIHPADRRVETDAGPFDADILVVALGADVIPTATPGLAEGGHQFFTLAGASAANGALARFVGGRVVVGVTSLPFKCLPAPSEAALMVHEYLAEHGLGHRSEVALVMPTETPVPPSRAASDALLSAFAEHGISWYPKRAVLALDPARKVAVLSGGEELAYDLFLGVPVHRAPAVVLESGLCRDGWIPVDRSTLTTAFPGVFAIGDVTSVGTPKAGVFAEGQAAAVANAIIATQHGRGQPGPYEGDGTCYADFGHDQIGLIRVTFRDGERPVGTFAGPSQDYAAEKSEFAASRIRRWFGNDTA
ncbi:NAD(P)/FAD-dependent oxidoreductase [Rathayibacter soli]|uniref:NAD(P)/FAD-dependent oxidoreductase n=1 Tax=Rathayibacter soli TaxID=3144168 RepID=UPI0027E488EE|nr:FAD/NAD(P)-binding oxidoreductase [Glaciibacter superstes]